MTKQELGKTTRNRMRLLHRYIGFFMVGIMAVYSISGILLIYRDTHVFRKSTVVERQISPNLGENELLKMDDFKKSKVAKNDNKMIVFETSPLLSDAKYNVRTGHLQYVKWDYPFVLQKLVDLHKAKSKEKLSFLNLIFGLCLLFFVVSSFWMFKPKTQIFKKAMIYTLLGLLFALLLVLL